MKRQDEKSNRLSWALLAVGWAAVFYWMLSQ